jgi:hypothetical protein
MAPRHCPRCIARFARAVPLEPRKKPDRRRFWRSRPAEEASRWTRSE